jgi:Helix-turn-helix domain
VSIKVMTEVWDSSSAKGGARLVLLALADHANDEGYCYPSLSRLARKSRLSERNVQFILRDLETRGELVILRGSGRGNVNTYWVLPPMTVARLKLEGKTLKSFHPLATLEQRVKDSTQSVQIDAERVKVEAQRVKPTSPRTIKNPAEPSGTFSSAETKNLEIEENTTTSQSWELKDRHEVSSAARTTLGTNNGVERGSAPRLTLSGDAGQRAYPFQRQSHHTDDVPPQSIPSDPYSRYR